MTRDDANDMVSKLVSRGRKQSEEMVKELEALLEQARKQVERSTTRARRQTKGTAGKVAKRARDAADEPLAQIDKVRRKAGVGSSFPITGYDELTAAQINRRLARSLEAGAAQGPDLREDQQGPQEHRRQDRQGARLSAQETQARKRPHRGTELELTIDSLAQGGRGVARTDEGFVIFVGGGLPGDRVRARVGKSKKSWAEAAIVELLEPAPERIADRCVHGGEPCPGAAWQGLPYELQLAEKQEQVAEALERLGGFTGEAVEVEPIVAAVEQWRYRNKLEYSFGIPAEGSGEPEPAARLPRPRPLGSGRRRRRLPARLRGQQRGPQRGPRAGRDPSACLPATTSRGPASSAT